MENLDRQREYWLQKIRTNLMVLQVNFCKPITDLTEAFENYVKILEAEKQLKKPKKSET